MQFDFGPSCAGLRGSFSKSRSCRSVHRIGKRLVIRGVSFSSSQETVLFPSEGCHTFTIISISIHLWSILIHLFFFDRLFLKLFVKLKAMALRRTLNIKVVFDHVYNFTGTQSFILVYDTHITVVRLGGRVCTIWLLFEAVAHWIFQIVALFGEGEIVHSTHFC